MKKRGLNHKAFTLIEVLISAVIATFISLVAIGALRTVVDARERVERNITAADELRFASNIIRNDLANICRDEKKDAMKFIGTVSDSPDQPPVSLTIDVVSTAKARPGHIEGDIYEVQYFVVTEDEKSILMRRYCPVVGIEEDDLTTGGILVPIAENIVSFSLLYFNGEEWVSEWSDEEEYLPGMVEVTLAASSPGETDINKLAVSSFITSFSRFSNAVKPDSASQQDSPETQQTPPQAG